MESEEEREKALVPISRRHVIPEKELPEESPEPHEVKVREIPRRWYVY